MEQGKKIETDPSEMKEILERTIGGTATAKDRRALQQALLGGQIVFTSGEGSIAAGQNIQSSMIISGKGNYVKIQLREPDYEDLRENLFPKPAGLAPPFPQLIFIGRENAMDDVKRLIGIGEEAAPKGAITVVRGWPGVGKTTLVGVLGRDADIEEAFPDGVLWTSLGQKPNLLSELARWGRALGTDELLRTPTLEDAIAQLRLLLQRKRMLLIVDDVWERDDAIPFIEACGDNNALLITTREFLNVSEELAGAFQAKVYRLPELEEEDALKLLRVLARDVVEEHPDECRELVVILERLPLSLHVAGNLLNAEAKIGFGVEELLEDLKTGKAILNAKTPADRKEATVSALLNKSTDLLSEEARECFAFLGPFAPKPATFDVAAMKAMWQMDDPRPIIRELVSHGLLEPAPGGRFQMHALLVAHAVSMLEG